MATLLLEIPQTARTLLKREAFENTILQFAQYVKYLKANKCSCLQDDIGRPDANCQYCLGKGFYYTFPADLRIYNEKAFVSNDRELTVDYANIKEVLSVRRKINGQWYNIDVDRFEGKKIYINKCEDFKKYYPFYVDYIFDPYIDFECEGIYLGEGNIWVKDIELTLDRGGVVIPDIISIDYVKKNSVEYKVNDFSRNKVNIEYSGNMSETLTVKGKYIQSWLFGVLNIQMKNRYESAYVSVDGDANIIVPNFITAGERDVFMLTMAEDRKTEILGRQSESDKDELSSFDVSRIIKITEITNTGLKEYENNKDFILWNRNYIKWLTDNRPEKLYTVEYLYHPSFITIPQVPSIRYPQNDRFPRKIVVKYLDKNTMDKYEVVK